MVHDGIQCVKPDFSKADIRVSILGGSWNILAVIYMEYRDLFLSENAVEFFCDIVKWWMMS